MTRDVDVISGSYSLMPASPRRSCLSDDFNGFPQGGQAGGTNHPAMAMEGVLHAVLHLVGVGFQEFPDFLTDPEGMSEEGGG